VKGMVVLSLQTAFSGLNFFDIKEKITPYHPATQTKKAAKL
jgi:hypothetical protein